ncbi:hypothetical protein GCM10022377_27130 [Zhihengliuella alba]|uniref:Uncharacterized protein n=1 Tax=Zhihengliuella alba TaxID=547018 RepID=A0ABP7E193_9MICC
MFSDWHIVTICGGVVGTILTSMVRTRPHGVVLPLNDVDGAQRAGSPHGSGYYLGVEALPAASPGYMFTLLSRSLRRHTFTNITHIPTCRSGRAGIRQRRKLCSLG